MKKQNRANKKTSDVFGLSPHNEKVLGLILGLCPSVWHLHALHVVACVPSRYFEFLKKKTEFWRDANVKDAKWRASGK